MPFELEKVVPWGRSFEEYVSMFSLANRELSMSILGCGDGPASFNCRMHADGGRVISVDPLYHFSGKEIEKRIAATFDTVLEQTEKNRDEFIWQRIKSVQELGEVRKKAMGEFLSDFEQGKSDGRYVSGSLPTLNFAEQEFDLALCSHFLFLYSKQLSRRFHIDSIIELGRVAKEVRIFPILELGAALSRHFAKVCEQLQRNGFFVETIRVDYEFQKGGNRMLQVRRTTD